MFTNVKLFTSVTLYLKVYKENKKCDNSILSIYNN